MPAEWIDLGKELLKLAVRPRYSFSIWVTALLLLAIPLPDFLRVDTIRTDYGHYVGIVCLAAFVLWLVEVVLFFVSDPIRTYVYQKEKLKHLDSLNATEAELLVHAVEKKCQTVTWRTDSGAPDSLVAKGLLERVPVASPNRFGFDPYTIPRFVWERITKEHVFNKIKEIKAPTL
jgi:hypothetical protein